MSRVGQPERVTQNRVIALFRDELDYRYLGNWTDRDGNSNVEEALLSAWLNRRGYAPAKIRVALHKLRTEADTRRRKVRRRSIGRGRLPPARRGAPREGAR